MPNDGAQVRGAGTAALFARIKQIAEALHQAGHDPAAGPDSAIDLRRAYIQREAGKQVEPVAGKLPDHADALSDSTSFGRNVSYLHNEFNFNSARPIAMVALVSHISFIPIFPPKGPGGKARRPDGTVEGEGPLWATEVPKQLRDRLLRLRQRAVHGLAPDSFINEDFRGGRDAISKTTDTFLAFDEPIITTKRSVERIHDRIRSHFRGDPTRIHFAHQATAWNDKVGKAVNENGASSRASMFREHMLLLDEARHASLRLDWVRRHSRYQTFTLIEQTDVDPATLGDPNHRTDDAATATLTVNTLLNDIKAIPGLKPDADLLQRTAFDALPDGWADWIFGRYLQGANYLVLPLEIFFAPQYMAYCATYQRPDTSYGQSWPDLCREVHALFGTATAGATLDAPTFRTMWQRATADPVCQRAVAKLALRLLGPMIDVSFPTRAGESDFEFVMCGIAHGAGFLLSDVRNFSKSRERSLMSATIVVDVALNPYERGRLMKSLTEFSTLRFLSLSALGTFRFFNDALDVIQADLGRANKIWLGASDFTAEDHGPGSHETKAGRQTAHQLDEADKRRQERDRKFIDQLKGITIDLVMLNDLVDGGISGYASSTEATREVMRTYLSAIGHYDLPGFLSLSGFLDKRLFKGVRTIAAVGRRYTLLRARIAELSALVEAEVQIAENRSQTRLLDKIDRLTLFGITYYLGSMLAYIIGGFYYFIARPNDMNEAVDFAEIAKALVFIPLFAAAWWIGSEVFRLLGEEFSESPRLGLFRLTALKEGYPARRIDAMRRPPRGPE